MSMKRERVSFTLTPAARDLLTRMCEGEGLSRSALIEIAIRDMAKRRKYPLTAKDDA